MWFLSYRQELTKIKLVWLFFFPNLMVDRFICLWYLAFPGSLLWDPSFYSFLLFMLFLNNFTNKAKFKHLSTQVYAHWYAVPKTRYQILTFLRDHKVCRVIIFANMVDRPVCGYPIMHLDWRPVYGYFDTVTNCAN